MKNIVIIGAGLGGLAAALRLSTAGYQVTILEKNAQPGGRLNEIAIDGFKFDIGPSFMSMSYELEELFHSCGRKNPLRLKPLDPLYQVFFEGRQCPFRIWPDLEKFSEEFEEIEPMAGEKVKRYLKQAQDFYQDTEYAVIKTNFYGYADYARKLLRVPLKHLPYLFQNMWQQAQRHFSSEEMRMIFCLVAFFLGSTPFRTPAIYSLLNYIEFRHNGYWTIEGGMYQLVSELVKILREQGVQLVYDTQVTKVNVQGNQVFDLEDQRGRHWTGDVFISNADAAVFRGELLNRPRYSPERRDKMDWSMAPFTLYLGVQGKIPQLMHHNYFLGKDFKDYAAKIFTSTHSPQKPYYYVNVPTKWCPEFAPEGCESVFVLCPVPDLRYKKDWSDADALAQTIIQDLSRRIGYNIKDNLRVKKILTPEDWARMFNLHRGSGLGLCHGINQTGIFRPSNKDEQLRNLYYVGASTIPGTGLPMVLISSKLLQERIDHDYGALPPNLL